MMVYQKCKVVVMKEYLYDFDPCRQFDFDNFEKDGEEELVDLEEFDERFLDEDLPIDREEQIFDLVEIPSFVTVFTGVCKFSWLQSIQSKELDYCEDTYFSKKITM